MSRRSPRDPVRTARRAGGVRPRGLGTFRRLRRRAAGDEGSSAIELVLFMPLLFFGIFVTVQFGFIFLGNSAASSAARETARIVRTGAGSDASFAQAEARGNEILSTIGRGLYEGTPTIQIDPVGDDEVRVVVTVQGVSVVPGLPSPTIEQVVQGPLEEFRGDTGAL